MKTSPPLMIIALLAACSGETSAPAPEEPAEAPLVSTTAPAIPPVAPTPPTPPAAPTAADLAAEAADAGRYDEVCVYLATRGFADDVCAWIAGIASGHGPDLSSRRLEAFLRRSQHVRRVSGSIVDVIGPDEYETRVGGRLAILTTTETSYSTTGRFTLWGQPSGSSEEVLESGRTVDVPIYREWPLFDAIRDLARHRSGDERTALARSMLDDLLIRWDTDYCYIDADTGDCAL